MTEGYRRADFKAQGVRSNAPIRSTIKFEILTKLASRGACTFRSLTIVLQHGKRVGCGNVGDFKHGDMILDVCLTLKHLWRGGQRTTSTKNSELHLERGVSFKTGRSKSDG